MDARDKAFKKLTKEFRRKGNIIKSDAREEIQDPLAELVKKLDLDADLMRPRRFQGPAPDGGEHHVVEHQLGDKVVPPLDPNADHLKNLLEDVVNLPSDDADNLADFPHWSDVSEIFGGPVGTWLSAVESHKHVSDSIKEYVRKERLEMVPQMEEAKKTLEKLRQLPQTRKNKIQVKKVEYTMKKLERIMEELYKGRCA